MSKGIPCLTEIQKQEIIKRVTDKGKREVDLAKEFKVDPAPPIKLCLIPLLINQEIEHFWQMLN